MNHKHLPISWASAKLDDLIVFALGGDWGKDPEYSEPDYLDVRCIRASEIKNWNFEKGSTAAHRRIKRASLDSRQLKVGDVLVEVSGGGPEQPVGRTVLIDRTAINTNPELPKVCTNFFRLIRPSAQLSAEYINGFLQHFYATGKIASFQAGSNNLRNLKFNDFIQIEIPLPPVAEQRRIVAKIEELFSELDKGVESLKTAREQLKVYRQAVLKHAFEGKLTAKWREENRAARWTYTTLGKQLTYLTSGSRGWADYYSDKGSIFIRAQNIKTDSLELEDIAFVQLPEKAEGMRTRVQQGDVLITITGANVTKTAFLDRDIGDAYVSQHVALCRPKDSIDTEFLYWFLVSEAFGRKQLKDAAYGAGKPGLNLENIRSTELPLPGMQEQKEIVREIQHQLSAEIIAGESIDVELGRSEALRQSILKKAFSGQLVPQDPNDEPASVLLERIRAEKAAQAKGGKRAKVPA